jgi:hypothetical protein
MNSTTTPSALMKLANEAKLGRQNRKETETKRKRPKMAKKMPKKESGKKKRRNEAPIFTDYTAHFARK